MSEVVTQLCLNCGSTSAKVDSKSGDTVCTECGTVPEDDFMVPDRHFPAAKTRLESAVMSFRLEFVLHFESRVPCQYPTYFVPLSSLFHSYICIQGVRDKMPGVWLPRYLE